jgi:hypothetical protein
MSVEVQIRRSAPHQILADGQRFVVMVKRSLFIA